MKTRILLSVLCPVFMCLSAFGAPDGVRAYDFGPANSPVWEGFTRVGTAAYTEAAELGWQTRGKLLTFQQPGAHPGFVGGLHDPLVVDGIHMRSTYPTEFRVDLPNGRYAVWALTSFYRVSFCNALWGRHAIAAEGKTVWELNVDKSNFFEIFYHHINQDYDDALRREGVWKRYLEPWLDNWKPFETTVKDGQLDLSFTLNSDRLHALVIAPLAQREQGEAYISKTSREREKWFTDRWQEDAPKQEGKPAAVTAEDRERGYLLFGKHWMTEVNPYLLPTEEEREPTLKLMAAPGEREPVAFFLRALKDLKRIEVGVSDLTGPDGATIPASAFEHWVVRYETRPFPGGTYQIVPVTLEKRPPIDLDADITKMYFLKVLVPEDATAGIYQGTITVRPSNASPSRIPIKMRVLPFGLAYPHGTSFTVEFGSVARYLRPKLSDPEIKRAFWEWVRAYLRNYREHNMTSIRNQWMPAVNVEGDAVTLDWTGGGRDYYNVDRLMEMYKEEGFTGPVVMYQGMMSIVFWGLRLHNSRTSLETIRSERSQKLITDATRQVRDHVKAKGWPEFALYTTGEPTNFDDGVEKAIAMFKAMKRAPGIKTAMSSINTRDHAAFPWVDVILFGSPSQNNMGEKMRAEGKEIWGYNCGVSRLSYGFYVWANHMEGRTQEHFQSRLQDRPFNDFLGSGSVWSYTHVAFGPEGVRPTLRLEHEAEGVDDFRYLLTLEKAVAEARRAGGKAAVAADRASELLERIRKHVPEDMRVFNAEGGKWEPGVYDRLRSRIASEIIALQAAAK